MPWDDSKVRWNNPIRISVVASEDNFSIGINKGRILNTNWRLLVFMLDSFRFTREKAPI